jgi:hypothetical protein
MISSTSARRLQPALPWDQRQTTILFPGLYESEDSDSSLTLRACYEKFLLPHLRHKSKDHRTKFRTMLAHWERLMEGDGPLPIAHLDGNDNALLTFQSRLLELKPSENGGRKITAATVNGYVQQYLGQLLRICGPRDPRNRRGKGIIRVIPYCEPLPVRQRLPRTSTLDELSRFYEACKVATWPQTRSLPAPLWWRVLYVLSFSIGPRTCDLAPIKIRGMGLTYREVSRSDACPFLEDVVDLKNADGWITFLPGKTENEKPELIVPMTSVVRRHVDALPSRAPTALLLPCTTHYDDFRDQRQAIEQAAGLTRAVTLQVVRRSCTSYWHALNRDVGRYMTGHAARGVNAESYLNALIPLLERPADEPRMLDQFRYPEAFVAGP